MQSGTKAIKVEIAYEGLKSKDKIRKMVNNILDETEREVKLKEKLKSIKFNNKFDEKEMDKFLKENKEVIKLVVE